MDDWQWVIAALMERPHTLVELRDLLDGDMYAMATIVNILDRQELVWIATLPGYVKKSVGLTPAGQHAFILCDGCGNPWRRSDVQVVIDADDTLSALCKDCTA
jgi:hypothetical protein